MISETFVLILHEIFERKCNDETDILSSTMIIRYLCNSSSKYKFSLDNYFKIELEVYFLINKFLIIRNIILFNLFVMIEYKFYKTFIHYVL